MCHQKGLILLPVSREGTICSAFEQHHSNKEHKLRGKGELHYEVHSEQQHRREGQQLQLKW
jgi:predicted membrane GTPase involved in stress response